MELIKPGLTSRAQSTTSIYSISGAISPSASGAGATVTLSGAAGATTTADANGNYSFTQLANGGYTVTPSKSGFTFSPQSQSVTISGGNQVNINFTATASNGALARDVTISQDGASASTTIVTPAFSTAAGGELLLAFVTTDYLSGTNTTVKSVAGGGLTWTLIKRANTQTRHIGDMGSHDCCPANRNDGDRHPIAERHLVNHSHELHGC